MPGILSTVVEAMSASGVDIAALGLAWARVMPTVTLVPAFGLRALPVPARAVLGLALAASVFPALTPIATSTNVPWVLLAIGEVLHGLPIALAAAIPLWAATMAGGLVDALRGANDLADAPTVEGRPTPLGVPLSILACAIFLGTGGPSRVVAALATRGASSADHPLLAAANDIVGGIGLAIALGGPLLAAAVIIEIAAALVARAASPAQIHALLAPIRALGVLGVMAIVLERMAAAMSAAILRVP